MKLKSVGIFLMAIMIGMTGARAEGLISNYYAGLGVGGGRAMLFVGDDLNTAAAQSYGAVLGIDLPLIQAELEYDYLNDSDIYGMIGMANVYLKIPRTFMIVSPYVGAGAGVFFAGKINDISSRTVAAYQGMLGVTFNVPALPVHLDLEVRALFVPDVVYAWGYKPDVIHGDVRLKLRALF